MWKRPTDTEGRPINPELFQLLLCAEYKITRGCSSQHQSSLTLMFDLMLNQSINQSELIDLFFFFQLDADRDEEEVFYDISMTLDNKLFPSTEPAAGEMTISATQHVNMFTFKN